MAILSIRAYLHGGEKPQEGEVTRLGGITLNHNFTPLVPTKFEFHAIPTLIFNVRVCRLVHFNGKISALAK